MLTVHPHIRGEYATAGTGNKLGYGSSPHPWGIPQLLGQTPCSFRFIPTSVGNTKYVTHRIPPTAVHPHIRGEYSWRYGSIFCDRGSSPHPWGIQERAMDDELAERFIPTSVGNTPEDACGAK